VRCQIQVFIHTRLSRAYLALARLSCTVRLNTNRIRINASDVKRGQNLKAEAEAEAELRGRSRGRGQDYEVEAEAKNNYETSTK